MKTLALSAAAALAVSTSASAALLLVVDLSVTDQVTITSTTGASSATINGSDGTGVYLEGFYSGDRASGVSDTLVTGDLTNVGNASSGAPNLFTSGLVDTGLNIFAWSPDATVDFTSGSQAFTGSATWTLASDDYAEMVAGNSGGDIYFPADDAGDLATAVVIGQWSVIPEPGSLALLGLGGLAVLRRRR
ncbi:MAG: PEP-CTERM sorting domain-containing protein [Phycisphaerales bacterium JB063]